MKCYTCGAAFVAECDGAPLRPVCGCLDVYGPSKIRVEEREDGGMQLYIDGELRGGYSCFSTAVGLLGDLVAHIEDERDAAIDDLELHKSIRVAQGATIKKLREERDALQEDIAIYKRTLRDVANLLRDTKTIIGEE